MVRLSALVVIVAAGISGAPSDRDSAGLVIDQALVTIIEQADVPARVEGALAAIHVREGALVDAGTLLGQVEDGEPQLVLERAKIEHAIAAKQAKNDGKVRLAKKALELAQVEYRRALESTEKYRKSVSDSELDKLRLAADRAAIEVEEAIHDHEIAQLTAQQKDVERQVAQFAVDRRRILAPIGGLVVQVSQHPGEWAQPGKPVFRLLRVDRLRVEAFVPYKKLDGDVTGRHVTLRVDLSGRGPTDFEGRVVFVSPEVNPVNGQVRVWAEVENRELLLKPGLKGSLTLHAEEAQAASRGTK